MKLRYTRLAAEDLNSSFEHLAIDDPVAATSVAQAIRYSIERLIRFPGYGRPGDVDGTRQFVVAGLPYIVVYEVKDDSITVLRIYHTSRDWIGSSTDQSDT